MKKSAGNRTGFLGRYAGSEQGFALILTMSMLAVLSVLGVMVLNSSDTELKITRNSRSNSDAFIAAELAVEYAQQKVIDEKEDIGEGTNYDLIDDDDEIADLLPDGMTLEATGRNEIDFYTGLAPKNMLSNTSTDVFMNNIYRTSASGDSGDTGDAAYYRVSIEAKANGRSSARLESLFVNRGGQVF